MASGAGASAAIERLHVARHPRGGETSFKTRPRGAPQLTRPSGVCQNAHDRLPESRGIVGRNEHPAPTIHDDFKRPTSARGNHRFAQSHRLDQGEAERLRRAWQHKQISGIN